MKIQSDNRQLLLQWYEQMALCFERQLSAQERADLEQWDREWVDGGAHISTSDWPGWEKHIGKRPNLSVDIAKERSA